MSGKDLDVVGEMVEQLASGEEEVPRATAGEIGAGCPDVCVE